MEKNKVALKKVTVSSMLIVMALSLYFNYHLYKENHDFKVYMGAAHQKTVALTLFRLNENDADFWIETLQKEEEGEVLLERYIGHLNELVQGYMEMSSEVHVIGTQIEHISRQYQELEKSLNAGEDIEVYKKDIKNNITFLRKVLKQVELNLSGNEVHWYKELSGFETKTGNYIWAQYKAWESEKNDDLSLTGAGVE